MINNQKSSFRASKGSEEAKIKMRTKFSSPSKGVALYLALMVLGILLALALGISAILYGQQKAMKGMGDSVLSLYAANTGIERTLYEISQGAGIGGHYEETLENGASYIADILAPDGSCLAANYCVKSVGIYREIRRAIRVAR